MAKALYTSHYSYTCSANAGACACACHTYCSCHASELKQPYVVRMHEAQQHTSQVQAAQTAQVQDAEHGCWEAGGRWQTCGAEVEGLRIWRVHSSLEECHGQHSICMSLDGMLGGQLLLSAFG